MRILILTKKLPYPARDGEAIASGNIIRYLVEASHQVVVISIITQKHNFSLNDVPDEIKNKVEFHLVNADTAIHFKDAVMNLFGKLPYHISRFINKEIITLIEKVVQQNEFDIIQFEGLFLLPFVETIKKYSNAKLIYRSHNVEGVIWKRMAMKIKNPIKSCYLTMQADRLLKYELKMIPAINVIVPISTADEQYYKLHFPNILVTCIPTGIEEKFESNVMCNSGSIYFLGALDWLPNQQGLSWFIESVWPEVKVKIPEASLHIAGRNAPQMLIDKISTKCSFYGEVEDTRKFISDKCICIVPLFAGSGLKIKIIEALAAGKVVVTTHIGAEGMPLSLDNYLYISDVAEEMTELLVEILKEPNAALSKASEAKIIVEKKLLNTVLGKQLEEVYKNVSL
ncbi:MAG TPA: glycosyltransferase family 4 protein [Chitinophagales bacterium]|nr:glycosyltransferase family 4 protein [Chitinophagales bacterium]